MTPQQDPSVEAAREEARAAADSTSAAPAPKSAFSRPRPRIALVVTLMAAIVLLTILLPAGGTKYTEVHEITAAPAAYDGKTVAVVGGVKSVDLGLQQYAFNLTDYTDETVWIRVIAAGATDAQFQVGKKVMVEGRVDVEGGVARLLADRVSVGCPTDYRGGPPPQ